MPKARFVHPIWARLAKEFPNDPRLEHDLLCALPKILLQAIREAAPALLSKSDFKFETRLRQLGKSGFWRQVPFVYEVLDDCRRLQVDCPANDLDKRTKSLEGQLNELLNQELSDAGLDLPQIVNHRQAEQQLREEVQKRRRGYVGWLITHPSFRQEVASFRARWDLGPKSSAILTDLNTLSIKRRLSLKENAALYHDESMKFLRRWGLERFEHWELPVPVTPMLVSPNLLPVDLEPAGVSLFVPWYLLKDKNSRCTT